MRIFLYFLLTFSSVSMAMDKGFYDNLAIKSTSKEFLSNYQTFLHLENTIPIEHSCTRFLSDAYGDFFYKLGKRKDEPIFESKAKDYCSFIAGLTQSVTPNSLTIPQKEFIANYMLWTYIYDDAITALIDKLSSNSLRKFAGVGIVDSINNHVYDTWTAGLKGAEKPEYICPTYCSQILFKTDKFSAFTDLSDVAYIFGRQLSSLVSDDIEVLTEQVSFEFSSTLRGISEQYSGAPETETSYFLRHKKTGGVKLFFNINLLFLASNLGDEVDANELSELLKTNSYIIDLYSFGENSIIYSNDASGAKDIGGDDESLLAILIANRVKPLSLNTAKKHGEILELHLSSRAGFCSMLDLGAKLRSSFLQFNENLEKIFTLDIDTSTKILFEEAIANWVYGYHLYSPISSRYGRAFKAFMIALKGNFSEYQAYIETLARG